MNQRGVIILLSIIVIGFGFEEAYAGNHAGTTIDSLCDDNESADQFTNCIEYSENDPSIDEVIDEEIVEEVIFVEPEVRMYHVGIIIDETCELSLIRTNQFNACPEYEDVERIYPDTKIKVQYIPIIEDYDFTQKEKYKKHVIALKKDCIRFGYCDHFDIKEGKRVIAWYSPEAELYEYIDTVHIRSDMKIDNLNYIPRVTVNESIDALKENAENQETLKDEYAENLVRINELKELGILESGSSDSRTDKIKLLQEQIRDARTWAEYDQSNPEFREEGLEKIKELEEELKEEKDSQSSGNKDGIDRRNELDKLVDTNRELNDEIRGITKEILYHKDRISPKAKIEIISEQRGVLFNVNQLYIDPTCSDGYFRADNYYFEILTLVYHMSYNCRDAELLKSFDLSYTLEADTHVWDITTSPNWQYRQWVEASKEKCKDRC